MKRNDRLMRDNVGALHYRSVRVAPEGVGCSVATASHRAWPNTRGTHNCWRVLLTRTTRIVEGHLLTEMLQIAWEANMFFVVLE